MTYGESLTLEDWINTINVVFKDSGFQNKIHNRELCINTKSKKITRAFLDKRLNIQENSPGDFPSFLRKILV